MLDSGTDPSMGWGCDETSVGWVEPRLRAETDRTLGIIRLVSVSLGVRLLPRHWFLQEELYPKGVLGFWVFVIVDVFAKGWRARD